MVTVGMNYEVLEGKGEAFERKFALVVEAMSKTPGHLATSLYRDVGAERRYLVVSEWTDRDAFDAFVASDAFKRVTAWGASAILAARPSHRVYPDQDSLAGRCPAREVA